MADIVRNAEDTWKGCHSSRQAVRRAGYMVPSRLPMWK
jgi:hypothetical protein